MALRPHDEESRREDHAVRSLGRKRHVISTTFVARSVSVVAERIGKHQTRTISPRHDLSVPDLPTVLQVTKDFLRTAGLVSSEAR